jgi:hypothetical protein
MPQPYLKLRNAPANHSNRRTARTTPIRSTPPAWYFYAATFNLATARIETENLV